MGLALGKVLRRGTSPAALAIAVAALASAWLLRTKRGALFAGIATKQRRRRRPLGLGLRHLEKQLQDGGEQAEEALCSTLEHAVAALEGLPASSPRKRRKAARALCERIEAELERVEDNELAGQLAGCEGSLLSTLAERIHAVSALRVGGDTEECVGVVSGLLAALNECRDVLQPAVGDVDTSLIATFPAMWIGMGAVTAAVAVAAARKKQ